MVSSVLFAEGCDLRCPYCQNPSLVEAGGGDRQDLGSIDDALAFLRRRVGLVSGVVISGGEPTLYAELPSLVEEVKAMGFAVKVDTNGSRPEAIAALRADYLAMDIKTDPRRYRELWPAAPVDAADIIARGVRVVRASEAEYEFRVTCAPGFVGLEDAAAIATLLEPEDRVFLQRYSPVSTLDPVWAAAAVQPSEKELSAILAVIKQAAPKAELRRA